MKEPIIKNEFTMTFRVSDNIGIDEQMAIEKIGNKYHILAYNHLLPRVEVVVPAKGLGNSVPKIGDYIDVTGEISSTYEYKTRDGIKHTGLKIDAESAVPSEMLDLPDPEGYIDPAELWG